MSTILRKITDKAEALDNAHGSSLGGYLFNTTYNDLYEAFGAPTFDSESGDGKVQFEWVFEFNGNCYTIYDWKTYSVEESLNRLTKWNIGCKEYYGEFSDHIESILKSKKHA
jgi:hypothetical protein